MPIKKFKDAQNTSYMDSKVHSNKQLRVENKMPLVFIHQSIKVSGVGLSRNL